MPTTRSSSSSTAGEDTRLRVTAQFASITDILDRAPMSSGSTPLEEELVININPEDMFFEDEEEQMETETHENNNSGSEADISEADSHGSVFFSDEDSDAVAPGLLDRSFDYDSMPDPVSYTHLTLPTKA